MQTLSSQCPACDGPLTFNASSEPRYEPCPACDCRVLVPKPTADDVARHYSRMFQGGNYRVSVEHGEATTRKFKHLLDGYLSQFARLGLPRPKSVLDIGCFTGEFLDAAAAAQDSGWPRWAAWAFAGGIVLFSGSLYVMALSGLRKLGAITPLGGLAFLAGWVCLLLAGLGG